jgi:hypothetical protein
MFQDIRDHLRGIHEAMLQFSQIQERLFSAAILEVEKRQVTKKSTGCRFGVLVQLLNVFLPTGEIQIDHRVFPPEH